jgi:hypothetical protein
MDEINRLHSSLDSIDNYTERNNTIQQMTVLISNQKEKLNLQLSKMDKNNIGFKIPVKYKKYSIDNLEKLLYETNDVDEKITIYYTIRLMVENIRNELFQSEIV